MRSLLKRFAIGASLAAASSLSGCMSASERAELEQKYAFSKSYGLQTRALSSLSAQAFFLQESGFGVLASHCTFGGYIFVERAVSAGRPLPVRRKSGGLFNIRPKMGCERPEMSEIALTSEQFSSAAQQGFRFRLIGSRGAIEGDVPAAAFQEVFAKAGKGRPIAAWLQKQGAPATVPKPPVATPEVEPIAKPKGIVVKM
jgi:hypothetical protein